MTTSGTTSFSPTVQDIIEEAAERAGYEIRDGYGLRTAIRSLNFLAAEWASRGLNLFTIDQQTITTIIGQTAYTLPADTIDAIEVVWSQNYNTPQRLDISMERYSVSQWAQFAIKNAPGPPYAYWIQRLDDAPIMNVWFQPDQAYTISYWRLRRIQDAGTVSNTMDMPFRFIPALVAGLAYQLSTKHKGSEQRVAPLQAAYEAAFQLAADEDRDRASVFFLPYSDTY